MIALLTKSRGALGSGVEALIYYFGRQLYNKWETEGVGSLHTILLIIETILLRL